MSPVAPSAGGAIRPHRWFSAAGHRGRSVGSSGAWTIVSDVHCASTVASGNSPSAASASLSHAAPRRSIASRSGGSADGDGVAARAGPSASAWPHAPSATRQPSECAASTTRQPRPRSCRQSRASRAASASAPSCAPCHAAAASRYASRAFQRTSPHSQRKATVRTEGSIRSCSLAVRQRSTCSGRSADHEAKPGTTMSAGQSRGSSSSRRSGPATASNADAQSLSASLIKPPRGRSLAGFGLGGAAGLLDLGEGRHWRRLRRSRRARRRVRAPTPRRAPTNCGAHATAWRAPCGAEPTNGEASGSHHERSRICRPEIHAVAPRTGPRRDFADDHPPLTLRLRSRRNLSPATRRGRCVASLHPAHPGLDPCFPARRCCHRKP